MTKKWQPLPAKTLTGMLTVAAERLGITTEAVHVQYATLYLGDGVAALYAWSNPDHPRAGRSIIVSEANESLLLPSDVLYARHVHRFEAGERV